MRKILIILVVIIILLIIIALPAFRFDFESGSHRIIPTACDKQLGGKYKVYYKTSTMTQNNEEDYYYIEKNNEDLVTQIETAISSGKEIVVYYDTYIGFKGYLAPDSSPIIKIEEVEK